MTKEIKKLIKFLFSRVFIVGILILIQLGFLGWAIWGLGDYFIYVYMLFIGISLLVVFYIVNKTDNPSYKLAWVIPILAFPVFGGLFYLFVGGNRVSRKFRKDCNAIFKASIEALPPKQDIIQEIEVQNKAVAAQAQYLSCCVGYPVYKHTKTQYLSPGEAFFDVLIHDLEEAKHFIFMEYFIIEEGTMWNTIVDLLERKVAEGLDVRVLYDDAGTIQTLPYRYQEKLKVKGIQVGVFNEIKARLNLQMNNRDHRKITVIDGYIGFTGGINLADEYINEYMKHGHWKDAAIRLEGEAVESLTVMFLQLWEYTARTKEDYKKYGPHSFYEGKFETDGYVQPYGDSPLDDETVGANVYLNMIHKARKSIYINTPYLIIDNELVVALTLAAKSGVDIKIVTPHIPDKWYVHILTRAYYQQLIEAGIQIYEYKPGFIHSKTFLVDDEVGTVGTINLDYRSLYLHFECGIWMYKTQALQELKVDREDTLKQCIQISLEECYEVRWYVKLVRSILRVLAPLL